MFRSQLLHTPHTSHGPTPTAAAQQRDHQAEMDNRNYTTHPGTHTELILPSIIYLFIPKDLRSGALPDRIENSFRAMRDLLEQHQLMLQGVGKGLFALFKGH